MGGWLLNIELSLQVEVGPNVLFPSFLHQYPAGERVVIVWLD